MSRAFAAGLVMMLSVTGACKGDSPSNPPPANKTSCRGQMSSDELYRLQQRIAEGETVCPELIAPRVEIARGAVTLDGQRLAGEPAAGSVTSFEPLFEELKKGRETWKQIHPGDEFKPIVSVTAAPDTAATAGASILMTAARAGYPTFELRSGDLVLRFEHAMPRPPASRKRPDLDQPWGRVEDPGPDPPAPREELRVARKAPTEVNVRFSGRTSPRVGLDETVAAADLVALLTKECGKGGPPCAETLVVEVGDGAFHDAAALAHTVSSAPPFASRPPQIAFESPQPPRATAPLDSDRNATEAPKNAKLRVRLGAITARGSLSTDVLEKVIRDAEPGFRACYERSLAKDPNLTGRVAVRFLVARDGSAWVLGNGGSDLPNASMVACVIDVYRGLRFPKPGEDVVTVLSPLIFTPS